MKPSQGGIGSIPWFTGSDYKFTPEAEHGLRIKFGNRICPCSLGITILYGALGLYHPVFVRPTPGVIIISGVAPFSSVLCMLMASSVSESLGRLQ
ncbi:MAG: hypothetical protein M2R45_04404 [Verrucomicrobia subdivision 3 bacterium]|nr:hypothetical protein [Limisphaerales bacterium]MCS1417258.1 hypothetical protein [Limisphaerales bacterium]